MVSLPWFPAWNYHVLQKLFAALPHYSRSDRYLEFLVHYPLPSTWIFPLVFVLIWRRNDERRAERRLYLIKSLVAVAIAVLVSLVFRPLICWPAPARSLAFRTLFPRYLWGEGASNSFPSHSTLAYFIVSAGLWPVAPKVSTGLMLWTFALISLPRMYLGGHYPIDVIASVILGVAVLASIWQWNPTPAVRAWSVCEGKEARIRNLVLGLWVLELADGFRGAEFLFNIAQRLMTRA